MQVSIKSQREAINAEQTSIITIQWSISTSYSFASIGIDENSALLRKQLVQT